MQRRKFRMRLWRKKMRKGWVTSRMCLGLRGAHGLKLAMADLPVIRKAGEDDQSPSPPQRS
jgi:hypothetical protein